MEIPYADPFNVLQNSIMEVMNNRMIKLDDQYCIDVDSYNYTLQKVSTALTGKNAGKEYYKAIGYYSDITGALEAYYKENVRQELSKGSMTLTEALRTISDVADRVTQTIRSAVPEISVHRQTI